MRRVSCIVSKVHDGDTITVIYNTKTKKKVVVRLYGIDAPELPQFFGLESKNYLTGMIKDKKVLIEFLGGDQYNRQIGKIFIDKLYVNNEMVKSGYAHWFDVYAPIDEDLKQSEINAKNKQAGLWAYSNPIIPWKWRIIEKIKQLQAQLDKPVYQEKRIRDISVFVTDIDLDLIG